MRIGNRVHRLACTYALAAACTLLAACEKQGPEPAGSTEAASELAASELKWARAALERNPELKVLAVDAAKNSIQVTVKATGQTVSVTPGELAAIPIADLVALNAAAQVPTPEPEPAPELAAAPAASPTEAASPDDAKPASFTVERSNDRVRVTGPGLNIETTGGSGAQSSGMEQLRDRTIVCEGRRLMHLDNRRIQVDGDAIIARGGCELHLTNSQVVASGIGIVVEDAVVHVNNSGVQGGEASIDAAPNAKLHVQNSKFIGVLRRDEKTEVNDRGGNSWR